jgi:microcompartment protein CcmL/EutN
MNTEVLGIQEFSDTAVGAESLDAAVKVAPIRIVSVQVINPGKLVTVFTGDVASVEMSLRAARIAAGEGLLDELFLPQVEPGVVAALSGRTLADGWDAIGIVETATVTTGVAAADVALKRASVRLAQLRVDDAMGGRASVRLIGPVGEVEAAVDAARSFAREREALVRDVIIANPHDDLRVLFSTQKDGTT